MNEFPPKLKPLPSDVLFQRYRPADDPACLCSRCLLPIGKNEFAIEMFASSGRLMILRVNFAINFNNYKEVISPQITTLYLH